ncbi:MAG: hypothetical protein R2785_07350 [Flavobacteriaceae bacterium]
MSKEINTPQNNSEEVDLGQLFNFIGDAFNKLFRFFGSIIMYVFNLIVFSAKAVVKNYKIIFISMVLASILGYIYEKTKPDVYSSQMLVKPYFDSKYQLVTNINFYNALIGERDYKQLTEIFSINEEDAEKILEFEINPGPETENDRLVQYDKFVQSLDSVRAQEVSFDDFIDNRSIYSGEFFEISVKSYKKDIFRSLEEGLNSTFSNTYSTKKMEKRDSILAIERQTILSSLKEIDSLKKVYINVMLEESKSKDGSYTTKDGLSFIQEKTDTKEYDLLDKEISLKSKLSKIDAQQVEEDVFFDTLSSFQDVGAKYSTIYQKYSIIFPILTFAILCIVYLMTKAVRFVNKYEG